MSRPSPHEQPVVAHLAVDGTAGMAYLRLSPAPIPPGGVAAGMEVAAILDLDAEGNVLGIELLAWPAPR